MKSSKTAYKIGEFTVRCKNHPVDIFMRENRQRIKSDNVGKGVR